MARAGKVTLSPFAGSAPGADGVAVRTAAAGVAVLTGVAAAGAAVAGAGAAGVAVRTGVAAAGAPGVAVRTGVACAETDVDDVPTARLMMRPATIKAPPEISSHLLILDIAVAMSPPLCSLAPSLPHAVPNTRCGRHANQGPP
jgi:hypothetical protein